jgi:hypothetical protein
VVERWDEPSKNNFEILVGVVFVKLREEDAFKSKLGKRFSVKPVMIMVREP